MTTISTPTDTPAPPADYRGRHRRPEPEPAVWRLEERLADNNQPIGGHTDYPTRDTALGVHADVVHEIARLMADTDADEHTRRLAAEYGPHGTRRLTVTEVAR